MTARYHRYPHYHWAKEITAIIADDIRLQDATIIDAPCGDGAISYWLIRRGIGSKYKLVDISERATGIAKRLRPWAAARGIELTADREDIFKVRCFPGDEVWLLINSLYLLADPKRLVDRMRERSKYVVGLFPYIERSNYLCFEHEHPGRNVNEMNEPATIELFERCGYALKAKREVTFIPFHCLYARLRYLPPKLVQRAAPLLLSPVERLVPKRESSYWIGAFERRSLQPEPAGP